MSLKKQIEISFDFPAYHSWPDAPEEVAFLRNQHRHLFKCKLRFNVLHSDREKEFFILKNKILRYVNSLLLNQDMGAKSCEMIAEDLLTGFGGVWAYVSEDGENAGIVWKEEKK